VIKKLLKPILIVEDETIMRESLRDWLTDGGYEVETANEGEQALKAIAERDFDLVLLDLRLPGKNGMEVLQEGRQIRPNLKVVIITGYPSVDTAVQSMKQGAVDYLPKPLNLDDLEKLIQGTMVPQRRATGQMEVTGQPIAKVTFNKNNEGISLTLTGWEYIDAYLDI
jgi:DNA-binding NtrC family response regulator